MVATSGKGWRLAPSLVALMAEVDAAYPGRPTGSDGSIGDEAHAARPSEHNPDRDSDPMPNGYVSAVDITKASPQMAAEVLRKLIADPRTWYVIYDGFIYSRTRGFSKQRYPGSNPHKGHLHLSLMQTATAAGSRAPWGIAPVKPKPVPKPNPDEPAGHAPGERAIGRENTGRDVAFLQRWLGLPDDGDFGPKTTAAVKAYQKMRGLPADGVVGPRTWASILKGN